MKYLMMNLSQKSAVRRNAKGDKRNQKNARKNA